MASGIGLGRVRHLEVNCLWTQGAVKLRRLEVVKVRGEANPADIMTKPKNIGTVKAVFDLYTSMEVEERET